MSRAIHTASFLTIVTLAAACTGAADLANVDGSRAVQGLDADLDAAAEPEAGDDRYIIGLRDSARGTAAIAALGGVIVRELGPQRAVAARIPAAAVPGLRSNPYVATIEVDPRRFPAGQSTPYGIDMVQAPLVWPEAVGAGKKMCIIDSGFSLAHDDLQHANVSGHPSDWSVDRCGHGTHVAGTIAALNNTSGVIGVLPDGVSLYIVKVFGDDCSWAYASDLVDALNRCRTEGSNVVSMSLGGRFSSTTERTAFQAAWDTGMISVAAAGNDGNTRKSYPASYDSVISVAALDESGTVAGFSQKNDQVELAAPGVFVFSTVPWLEDDTATAAGTTWRGSHIDNAARTSGVAGALVDGGRCASAGAWLGKVVLCERGDISFFDKVMNVEAGGGIAALIYNDQPGHFLGTLGSGNASAVPALSFSRADGVAMLATALGSETSVVSVTGDTGSGYEAWDGTSMATPHVSAAAALVWSAEPSRTNAEVRAALQQSAVDLGAAGRDTAYGFGLVQARAAVDHLRLDEGDAGVVDDAGTAAIALAASGYKVRGMQKVDLAWSGATTSTVDVYRNGALVRTTPNDGAETDAIDRRGGGTYEYILCEAGSTFACSNAAVVVF